MRKLIFSALVVATSLTIHAQKLEDVQEKISKGKYDEAQEKIDKILADSKGQKNPNAWYNKGIVYYNLSLDTNRRDKDYIGEAYEAFMRYYQMDPKNVTGTLYQNGHLFQLYDGFFNGGVKTFNTKNYETSFRNFSRAVAVEDFINSKGFTYPGVVLPTLDTSLILNTAAAAAKANMQDSAMKYYQRLADAKITGENYIEIYQLLVDHYGKKNDLANQQKYLALGKELYPTSDYWYEIELGPIREDRPKLFAKYEELSSKNPKSYYLTYNYAVELFNYLYASGKLPADAATYTPKVEGAIQNAIQANATPDANLLMVRYLSEQIYRLEDSTRMVKGTKPEDVKRKQTLVTRTNALWDKMAPYAEAAFNGYATKEDLKGFEKGNMKFVSNVLVDYHNMKKQFDKAKGYQDKVKQLGI
ncbi:MAG TPA: hypothetical protein VEZ55_10485 [Chitinophagaceae bacterium]|jgi:hypothetical protein|nr:hypothetical protein [Chitinophagaceae bacterium]